MNEQTGELPPDMDSRIASLGYFRIRLEPVNAEIERRKAKHAAELAPLIAERDELLRYETEARAAVDQAAYALYNDNPAARVHPAITVKQIKKVFFDPDVMRRWALDHSPGLLKLDEVAVRRDAGKLVGAPVEVKEVPSVAVASNLAEWTPALGDAA